MKFLRLRVANYRGIDAAEVEFRPAGITVVQGPNEAGKTSLGEAIRLLFDYPDSSKHRSIEAILPVHRDEGPEVELWAESGPYAFSYFKRFHKRPQTTLRVSRPKPENLTGREAHERAEAILRETIDVDLWKALTVEQGDAIAQPNLSKQISLSSALDRAAGGHPADPRQESLFVRVMDEYNSYFTERGADKKLLQEARKVQEDTRAEIAGVDQQIRNLEQDIDRAASLQTELGQLKRREEDLAKALAGHTSVLDKISAIENALASARLKLESAQKSEQVARRDRDARQGLIDTVVAADRFHRELQVSSSMSLPALNQAEDELKKAQASAAAAGSASREAGIVAALRREDFDYYNNRLHLEQLSERKERIDQARKSAFRAEEELARNKVTSGMLKAIQKAEQDLLTARAKLEMGAPRIVLSGLAKCQVIIDGEEVTLGKGDSRDLSVAESMRLTIPRKLDIEVSAGAHLETLQQKAIEAQAELDRACKTAGVASADEARKACDDRREASRIVDIKVQVEKDNLRDLTYDELADKVVRLGQSVPAYLASRSKDPAICPDLETAKKERAGADAAQRKANSEWEMARGALDSARDVRDGLNKKHQEARVQLDLQAKALRQAQENLDRARKNTPDDMLEMNLDAAVRAVVAEEARAYSAEESLKLENPDRVRALAETARGSLQTTQVRQQAAHTELTEVQTRLKIHGEEGLHERLGMAQVRLERVEHENRGLFRRAAAARYLYESMREERDRARRAYVAPLKKKVDSLGRLVFDSTFEANISDDLRIDSRTAKGITVPFGSLSGGTREQVSLIFRLACSMMVANEGGTPLMVDDALGYTDPDRLQLMGSVLAQAAKECQVIVFTCVPDRYSNIGEATIVSLR